MVMTLEVAMGASSGEVGGVGGRDEDSAVSSLQKSVYRGAKSSRLCGQTVEAACGDWSPPSETWRHGMRPRLAGSKKT